VFKPVTCVGGTVSICVRVDGVFGVSRRGDGVALRVSSRSAAMASGGLCAASERLFFVAALRRAMLGGYRTARLLAGCNDDAVALNRVERAKLA
jgi:hypothetical protein